MATIGVSLLWLFTLYPSILMHPDEHMFSQSGDGIKNYYVFAYHVRHDADWLHFHGMNYPYPEHVLYTDGHPLFSLLFGWIPVVKNHPVGFLNLCMMLSILLTSIVLYSLLCRFGVEPWLACIGALGINWLGPQLFRMQGHLSLSYAWMIPLGILLMHRFIMLHRWKDVLSYSAFAVSVWFIHPYMGMALAMMPAAFFTFQSIHKLFSKSWNTGLGIKWIALIAAPMLLYFTFVKLTDFKTDRPPDAKGFIEYSASYECFFVPHDKPFRHLISQIIKVNSQNWEGLAYIGLASMLTILTAVYFFKTTLAFFRQNLFWAYLIFSGFAIALFACAFPFKQGHSELLNVIPYIEQFRAPGRFGWIFYFIITLFAFVVLQIIFLRILPYKNRRQYIIGILAFVLFIAEGWYPQMRVAREIAASKNIFRKEFIPEQIHNSVSELSTSDHNNICILPLPFYHHGSDYYGIPGLDEAKKFAYCLAFHTGVPLMSSQIGRASFSDCRALQSVVAFNVFKKNIWNDLPLNGAAYILKIEGDYTKEEKRISESNTNWLSWKNEMKNFSDFVDSLKVAKTNTSNMNECYLNDFNNNAIGKIELDPRYFLPLDTIDGARLSGHSRWVASVWAYYTDPDALYSFIRVEKYNGKENYWLNGQGLASSYYQFQDSTFIQFEFETEPGWNYRIFNKGSDNEEATVYFDHLMVRPAGINILDTNGVNKSNLIRYNNFPIVLE
ncbi:MAG: hypothetical protein ACKVOR_06285 [Flavobacteriales bacterium]